MIRAVHIERFRGIRKCVADGFGRVNLIIGRNDCGKTSFMEAISLAEDQRNPARSIVVRQARRLGRGAVPHDFARFWRPLFFDFQPALGFTIRVTQEDGRHLGLQVREGMALAVDLSGVGPDGAEAIADAVQSPAWALDVILRKDDSSSIQHVSGASNMVRLPPSASANGSAWIPISSAISDGDVRTVSTMKQLGQDHVLVELLREVEPRVTGVEILAPDGSLAELFVRLDNGTPMMPVGLMGEGFQRCVEIGSVAAGYDWPTMFLDEVENGMHHLVLEPLWRWLSIISRRRNIQIFATTHSEECIQAAARAFSSLNDDGLRVIRLDRTSDATRATIYDRKLVETAAQTDTEIRG